MVGPGFLVDQEFTTEKGYLVTFHEQEGNLQADVKIDATQKEFNYTNVPVMVAKGTRLTELSHLDKTIQKRCIQVEHTSTGKPNRIVVARGGLKGGMMEGSQTTSSRSVKLTDVKELRKYFFKGTLEITPQNCRDVLAASARYEDSFMSYDGMLVVKNWGNGDDLVTLADILQSFSKVTKLKASFLGEDVAELAEIIARGVQFYEELMELDVSGCQLGDGLLEDIMESVHLDNLKCINIANNNVSSELIVQLQESFSGIEFITQASASSSIRSRITSRSVTRNSGREGSSIVNRPNLSPNHSISLRDGVSEKGDEKSKGEKEVVPFYTPSEELTAYERLGFNKFLPAVAKGSIEYGIQLGRGGMGAVYQGTYQDKVVAVKKLIRLSAEEIAAFQKEAVIMSNYRHRNLISFLGCCPEEYAFMMEYASGGSLWSLLKSSEAISWEKRYEIGLDVAKGMEYLHDNGVVHCDLKSDNILLDSNMRAKITDFGISALRREHVNSGKSTYGEWEGGTYCWMAPEIFHTQKNTKAGDVYAYGLVLWQLGSRKVPFAGIEGLLPYISAGNKEVITTDTPPVMKQVIELCWLPEPPLKKATDTQNRPSMQEIRLSLEKGMEVMKGKELGLVEKETEKERGKELTTLEKEEELTEERENKQENNIEKEDKENKEREKELIQQLGIEAYQKAADQGDAGAQFNLGLCYERGQEVEINYQEAVKWYQKAAEQGKALAKARLARMYYRGDGIKKDSIKSNEILQGISKEIEASAEQGEREHQLILGWMYNLGQGVVQDYHKALEWYQKAADQGLAEAQNNLGWMYQQGLGVHKDNKKAVEWYQKAADQGLANAQNNMGIMYQNGWGVFRHDCTALECYQKAADQGFPWAEYNLGWMYESQKGVPPLHPAYPNYLKSRAYTQKAIEWYRKAAEHGHAEAQYELGKRYQSANGVNMDIYEAIKYYQEAADQGHAKAQLNIAYMYETGKGLEMDVRKAVEWYQKAADQGLADAKLKLNYLRALGYVI